MKTRGEEGGGDLPRRRRCLPGSRGRGGDKQGGREERRLPVFEDVVKRP